VARCSECGFIAARIWRTREFIEIDDRKRDSGNIKDEFGGDLESIPACFVNRFNIKEEVEAARKAAHDEPTRNSIGELIPPYWPNYVKEVLNRERACEYFIKWQQGFTPKEHREMMDRERMQKWQMEREEADRKWRSKEQWQLVIVAGIFTLLGAIIAWLLTRGGH
jgi:hypothetical protein